MAKTTLNHNHATTRDNLVKPVGVCVDVLNLSTINFTTTSFEDGNGFFIRAQTAGNLLVVPLEGDVDNPQTIDFTTEYRPELYKKIVANGSNTASGVIVGC